MKLFKLSQDTNNDYDTYDSAVVVAADADSAREIHPAKYKNEYWWDPEDPYISHDWAPQADIKAEYIGEAADNLEAGTIVCASFNAG